MNNKSTHQEPATQPETLPELLGRLAKSAVAVIHNEINLVIEQIHEKGRAVRSGILLIAAGAVFGVAGLVSLCAAAIIHVTAYMSPASAALVTGVVVTCAGIVIALIGYGQLKKSIRNP